MSPEERRAREFAMCAPCSRAAWERRSSSSRVSAPACARRTRSPASRAAPVLRPNIPPRPRSSVADRRENPNLITVSATGYGQDGPYADRPAFDDIVQSAEDALDVWDLQRVAEETVPTAHYGYIMTGVDGEETYANNRAALERLGPSGPDVEDPDAGGPGEARARREGT